MQERGEEKDRGYLNLGEKKLVRHLDFFLTWKGGQQLFLRGKPERRRERNCFIGEGEEEEVAYKQTPG